MKFRVIIFILIFTYLSIYQICASDIKKLAQKGYDLWLSGNFNKYRDALELFNEAVKKDPNNAEYHSAAGRILFDLGDYDKSFKELKTALSLDPQRAWIEAWTRICLGEIYEKREDYTSALKEYDYALKLYTTANSIQEASARKILVRWKHKETLHFVFSYPEGGIADRQIDDISFSYQKKYSDISSFLGVGLNDKIQCYLFPSVGKSLEIMGVKPDFSRPQARQIYTLYGTEEKSPPGLQIAIVLSYYIGKTRNREPLLQWGLAEFLTFPANDFEKDILELKSTKDFVPLTRLRYDFYGYSRDISFKESACFVKFLIDQYGLEKFKKIWVEEDIDKAFKKTYKKTFEELEAAWNNHLADKDKVIDTDKSHE